MEISGLSKRMIEKVSGDLGDKLRWRAYRARVAQLPPAHRDATKALERYLTYHGAIAKGGLLMDMLEDLLDLLEQAAADGTPVRSVVGEDPVEFAEEFLRNYADGQWINRERVRLTQAIQRAEASEGPQGAGPQGTEPGARP